MLRAGLKFLIKDALRGARYRVRRTGDGALSVPLPGSDRLSRIADGVLSSIEETVVAFRYGSDQAADLIAIALDAVDALQRPDHADAFEAHFASAGYRLARGILGLKGLDRAYLSELAFAEAGRRLRTGMMGRPALTTSAFAADIACALVASEPLRDLAPGDLRADDAFVRAPNQALAATLALTIAAWLGRSGSMSAADCAASATDIAIEAFDRFESAFAARPAAPALAGLLTELAPFAR